MGRRWQPELKETLRLATIRRRRPAPLRAAQPRRATWCPGPMRLLAAGPPCVLLTLLGCRDHPAPPLPPPPLTLRCGVDADRSSALGLRDTVEAALDDATQRGPAVIADRFAETRGGVGDVLGLATRRDPVRVATLVACPDAPFRLGQGLVTDVMVGLSTAVEAAAGAP